MKPFSITRLSEYGVLILVAFSILWRGGKGLESTWLLALCAAFLTLSFAAKRFLGIASTESAAPGRRGEVPLSVWMLSLGLIILSLLSYAHSSVQNYGLDVVLRTVSTSLLLLWIMRNSLEGTQSRFFQTFLQVLSVTAVMATIIGVAVYIFQPVNRFVGTFFDMRFDTDYWPNAWGDFVLLSWPLMALLALRTRHDRWRYLLTTGVALVIGSLLLSYSRGSLLAFGLQLSIGIAIFLYFTISDVRYKRILRANRTELLISIAGILAIAVSMFFAVNHIRSLQYDVQSVAEKVTFTAPEGTSSINERSQFWSQALSLSFDHPLLGYGPYSFRFVQPQMMQHVLATSDHPHNFILAMALDYGWPAAVLFTLILLLAIGSSFKMLANKRRDWSSERDLAAVLLLLSIIGVFAHDLIDYNLQFVGVALPLWICISFLFIRDGKETGITSFIRWQLSRTLFRMETVIGLLLLIVTITEGVGLLQSSVGRHAQASGYTDKALTWYRHARHEWFSRDMHLSEAEIYLQKDDPASALQAIELSMQDNAFDARSWKLKAMALLRQQDMKGAIEAIERAYALGKYTDIGMLELLLQTTRDPEQKKALLARKMEFDALFSAYAEAIESNTHFIALSHNVEELLSVARELSKLYPTDERRYKHIARRAAEHAKVEREKFAAREPGMLW